MIASLPMYDRPETEESFDRLWAHIRSRLQDGGLRAPRRLVRGHRAAELAWTDENLLLSQTCGLPLRTFLKGKATLVGTPDYGHRETPPGYYFSCLVARVGDERREFRQFDGCRLAYNAQSSQSGWAAPLAEARRIGIEFGSLLETGSHLSSARAVAERRADLAALDANSWRLMRRFDSFAASLREVGRTVPTPGLPFITAFPELANDLFVAITESLTLLQGDDAEIIGYRRLANLTAEQYEAVGNPSAAAPATS
ncbi:MAG: PhnD/SsuA/transferrin family substrate-binding protein [Albidovulum sp.]|nr:PhnD/SsuA/transferrin family substrate-binding protein [Albidovulum sp.]